MTNDSTVNPLDGRDSIPSSLPSEPAPSATSELESFFEDESTAPRRTAEESRSAQVSGPLEPIPIISIGTSISEIPAPIPSSDLEELVEEDIDTEIENVLPAWEPLPERTAVSSSPLTEVEGVPISSRLPALPALSPLIEPSALARPEGRSVVTALLPPRRLASSPEGRLTGVEAGFSLPVPPPAFAPALRPNELPPLPSNTSLLPPRPAMTMPAEGVGPKKAVSPMVAPLGSVASLDIEIVVAPEGFQVSTEPSRPIFEETYSETLDDADVSVEENRISETFTPRLPPPPSVAPGSASVSSPAPAGGVNSGRPEPPRRRRPSRGLPAEEVETARGPETIGRKRIQPWWEELFDDDFLRSLARLSEEQIVRETAFIEEHLGLAQGALILDLACGNGRHAVELTRRGYQVIGFDLSLAMLARAADEAEDAGQRINFLHGDMRDMSFENKFDGVYCWGTSFGFFDEEKNASVMHRIQRSLRPGGTLLVEVFNRDYVATRQPSLVWFEGDGCICMDEMQVDFFTSRLKVKRTLMLEDGRQREIEYAIRLYSLHELGKVLHEAGFRVVEVSGQMATPGVFFGAESPRCIVVAERD